MYNWVGYSIIRSVNLGVTNFLGKRVSSISWENGEILNSAVLKRCCLSAIPTSSKRG